MGKIKARKMLTPGSTPTSTPVSAGKASRGRPKKQGKVIKERGPYMRKYDVATRDEALAAIKAGRMSVLEASKHFKIPQAWLISILFYFLIAVGMLPYPIETNAKNKS